MIVAMLSLRFVTRTLHVLVWIWSDEPLIHSHPPPPSRPVASAVVNGTYLVVQLSIRICLFITIPMNHHMSLPHRGCNSRRDRSHRHLLEDILGVSLVFCGLVRIAEK